MTERNSRAKVIVVAIVMVASLGLCLYSLLSSLAYNREVDAAFAHGDHLQVLCQGDPRFTNVTASGQTGNPLIMMHGTVQTESDLIALRDIVSKSAPPLPVIADLHVGVLPTNKTWPVVAWKIDPENEFPWITERGAPTR